MSAAVQRRTKEPTTMSTMLPLSKRRQLGDLIAFLRTEQSMSVHNLADKTRSTTKEVSLWERGELVPTTQEWQRLRGVFHQLMAAGTRYRELFDQAAAEQRAFEEAREAQPEREHVASRTGDLDAAVRILVDAVPSLRSLTIEIDDDGTVSVSYKTREVRIVEDGGHLQVKLR